LVNNNFKGYEVGSLVPSPFNKLSHFVRICPAVSLAGIHSQKEQLKQTLESRFANLWHILHNWSLRWIT